jgi:aromatic-L-amino-acid decarboxylase
VKDKYSLIRTLQVVPEYLRTADQGKVNDYCDWSVPLGRRFRALKLWFVLRSFGIEGLQEKLRDHIRMARDLAEVIGQDEEFELMAPVTMNLVCFRYKPKGIDDENELNRINEALLKIINDSGQIFLTHTKLGGKYVLRMMIGQTNVEKRHVDSAWALVQSSKFKIQS